MTDLSHLARPCAILAPRVTPRTRRAGLAVVAPQIPISVAEPPEDGCATKAARDALAQALGVAKTRLVLRRRTRSRGRIFRLDQPGAFSIR